MKDGELVLKEKLKELKKYLRVWNLEHFGNLEKRESHISNQLNLIELKEDEGGLEEDEVVRKRELQGEFWRMFKQVLVN